eukprot:4337205-Amphidinium_carterae.3
MLQTDGGKPTVPNLVRNVRSTALLCSSSRVTGAGGAVAAASPSIQAPFLQIAFSVVQYNGGLPELPNNSAFTLQSFHHTGHASWLSHIGWLPDIEVQPPAKNH